MSIEDHKLKPCPFCGSSNIRLSKESGNMNRFIICEGCYARSSSFINEFDSIESWNNIQQDGESLVNKIKALIANESFKDEYTGADLIHTCDLQSLINEETEIKK